MRAGHAVIVLDNLSRGHLEAVNRLRELGQLTFIKGDCLSQRSLRILFEDHQIDAVLHFAALAYVGESVQQPMRYWLNNTAAAIALLKEAAKAGVRRFIFSSTCATYGEPPSERIPITEDCPQQPVNPYGRSKLAVEQAIIDCAAAARAEGRDFAAGILRYFNVAGCDATGLLGEDHRPETHLVPICLEVALGLRPHVTVFGDDYPTADGTCIRDYVHVDDLIAAHLLVMNALQPGEMRCYNIGIGRGQSVRDVVDAVRRVTGRDVPVEMGPRRPGDPPVLYAQADRIRNELGFVPRLKELDPIVETAWKWKRAHPKGYGEDK
jgi:UDP-glucose-4-epimerase GalE